ncbi:hypothetical protein [Heyndrickxia acidicola]|uniref:Coupling factor for flagellin transcription and translation n=1 Tax=Heyndrickxia acidicola TaxID=209389 RepID=A0ABU6MEE2_9BACI|nr:hypothetical protein [Heyndrickxia acidicola]MED1202048.1 hypothetical protein [Heyndrickxia acidicola]
MMTFLAAFSIVLNIIALLAIVILYLRQNRFLAAEKKQQQLMEEMENLFSAYIIEIKEENDRFIAGLNKAPIQPVPLKKEAGVHKDEENPLSELDMHVYEKEAEGVSRAIYGRMHASKTYQTSMTRNALSESELNDTGETMKLSLPNHNDTIIMQIYSMQDEGFTVDEIAKKLNKGKTEIELFMKFHRKDK